MERGQITYLIIIGVVLLITVNLIFFLSRSNKETSINQLNEIPLSLIPLEKFASECLKTVSEEGIILVGKQGGYINHKQNYLQTKTSKISYHYLDGDDISPSQEQVEKELKNYIKENIESCIKGFKSFKEQGFDISYDFSKTEIEINKDNIAITSNFNLEAKKEEAKTNLPFIRIILPVRLGYILTTSKVIVAKEVADPHWFDTEYLNIFDLQIDLYSHNASNKVFYLLDGKSTVKGRPYIFMFANRFK